MPYITTTDNTRIHFEDTGQGPVLLFLHGLSFSGRVWEGQVADLANRFRIITCDMRGHGRSDRPSSGYTGERMAQDLHELLESQDLREVTLVGWSMGAAVATTYARLYGRGRVKSVVLVEGTPRLLEAEGYPGVPGAAFDQMLAMVAADWPGFARHWVSGFFVSDPGEDTRRWLTEIAQETPPWLATELFQGAQQLDERAWLPEIKWPALVLHGEADTTVPLAHGQVFATMIPGARIFIFPACGHAPFIENREQFNQALAAFALESSPELQSAQDQHVGA